MALAEILRDVAAHEPQRRRAQGFDAAALVASDGHVDERRGASYDGDRAREDALALVHTPAGPVQLTALDDGDGARLRAPHVPHDYVDEDQVARVDEDGASVAFVAGDGRARVLVAAAVVAVVAPTRAVLERHVAQRQRRPLEDRENPPAAAALVACAAPVQDGGTADLDRRPVVDLDGLRQRDIGLQADVAAPDVVDGLVERRPQLCFIIDVVVGLGCEAPRRLGGAVRKRAPPRLRPHGEPRDDEGRQRALHHLSPILRPGPPGNGRQPRSSKDLLPCTKSVFATDEG